MAYILYFSLLGALACLQLVRGSEKPIEFGPYDVEIDGFLLCPGAQPLRASEFHPSISTEKDKPQRIQLNYTFYKEVFLDSIQLKASRYHESHSRLWNFSIKKPCRHLLFRAILIQQRVLRSIKDCIVRKGNFFFDWNIEDIMRSLLGSTSAYRRYTITIYIHTTRPKAQGPYVADFSRTKLTQCKGPKAVNQTIPNIWLMKKQNGPAFLGNITILTNTRLSEVQITVRNDTQGDNKKNAWTYKFKEPCKYDFLRKSFKQIHNNEDCFMYKGTYKIHVEVTKYIRFFLGETFFYGSYHARILGLSKNGNLYCFKFNILIAKKKK